MQRVIDRGRLSTQRPKMPMTSSEITKYERSKQNTKTPKSSIKICEERSRTSIEKHSIKAELHSRVSVMRVFTIEANCSWMMSSSFIRKAFAQKAKLSPNSLIIHERFPRVENVLQSSLVCIKIQCDITRSKKLFASIRGLACTKLFMYHIISEGWCWI